MSFMFRKATRSPPLYECSPRPVYHIFDSRQPVTLVLHICDTTLFNPKHRCVRAEHRLVDVLSALLALRAEI